MAATFSSSMNLHSHSLLSFLIILSAISLCFSQPLNIQTFYPFALPPLRPPIPTTPVQLSLLPPSPPPPPLLSPQPSSMKKAIRTAIQATAAGVLVLSRIFFVIFVRYSQSRRERGSGIAATNPYDDPYPNGSRDVGDRDEFSRFGGKVKGVIVDEEGLDVLYRRKLESGDAKESFRRERQVFNLSPVASPLPLQPISNARSAAAATSSSTIVCSSEAALPPPPPPPLLAIEKKSAQAAAWADLRPCLNTGRFMGVATPVPEYGLAQGRADARVLSRSPTPSQLQIFPCNLLPSCSKSVLSFIPEFLSYPIMVKSAPKLFISLHV
nr:formin-like protein 4 [Ipomoea batatas]